MKQNVQGRHGQKFKSFTILHVLLQPFHMFAECLFKHILRALFCVLFHEALK